MMPIDVKNITVGNCYETPTKQYRRVVENSENKVTYESWGGNAGYQGQHLHRNTVTIEKFANDVDNSIACPLNLPPVNGS